MWNLRGNVAHRRDGNAKENRFSARRAIHLYFNENPLKPDRIMYGMLKFWFGIKKESL